MFSRNVFLAVLVVVLKINLTLSQCENGNLYPDNDDCQVFYQCSHGELVKITCPAGLHFNHLINVCHYPENVNCETATEPESEWMETTSEQSTT